MPDEPVERRRGYWEGIVDERLKHLDACLDRLDQRREEMHAENLALLTELRKDVDALRRWRAMLTGLAMAASMMITMLYNALATYFGWHR